MTGHKVAIAITVLAMMAAGASLMVAMSQRVTRSGSTIQASVDKFRRPEVRTFKSDQENYSGVTAAIRSHEPALRKRFQDMRQTYPPRHLYLQAFMDSRVIEAWVGFGDVPLAPYLLRAYSLCQTDRPATAGSEYFRTWEGFYEINRFYSQDLKHGMSISINFPNAVDLKRSPRSGVPTSMHIRNGCQTSGPLQIEDGFQEVYLMAMEAHSAGQKKIPVHVFARRPSGGIPPRPMEPPASGSQKVGLFEQVYQQFEANRKIPEVQVGPDQRYVMTGHL